MKRALDVFRPVVILSIALVALASFARATTWIVDVNNGPGTNFTTIGAAVAAAVPGDVILVRPGSYSSFTLGRGITILGQGNVNVSGGMVVSGVPAGELAMITNLRPFLSFPLPPWRITNCAGTVCLQEVEERMVVQGCADVRIFRYNGLFDGDELDVSGSRVQTVQSSFLGSRGYDSLCQSLSEPGFPGITCWANSRVHAALTNARGGQGGNGDVCGYLGSDGAPGIDTEVSLGGGAVTLILSGPALITAGANGTFTSAPQVAPLRIGAGVTAWSSQMNYAPVAPSVYPGGVLIFSATPDPTLEMIGTPAPGAMITLRMSAAPGTAARLNVGRTPTLNTSPGVLVENLVVKERSFDRGFVPPSGFIDTPWLFQPGTPAGKLLIFQAKVTDPVTGLTQKSNSIEAVVP